MSVPNPPKASWWRRVCNLFWGEEPPGGTTDEPMDRCERRFVAFYIALMSLLLLYFFGKFWPVITDGKWVAQATEELFRGMITVKTSAEIRLIILVLCAGALGAMLHALQSFVDFHGNRQLVRSWLPWYLLRPFNGALLALVFFLLIEGRLVADVVKTVDASKVYTLAGVSALIGMFSELATIKLKDMFTTLFASPVKPRSDALQPARPKPEITEIKPASKSVGTADLKVTLVGTNFDKTAKVFANDKERKVSNPTSTQLTVELLPEDVAAKGVLKIIVENPAEAGGKSMPKDLPVS